MDFGLGIQQAIEAPRWSTQSFPSSTFPHTMRPGTLEVESRIPAAVRAALAAQGHRVTTADPWSLAKLAAILIDPRTGELPAGADPRADTYAGAK